MKLADLIQIKQDRQQGVMICRSTIDNLIDYALAQASIQANKEGNMNTTAELVKEVARLTQALADKDMALMEQTEIAQAANLQAETLETERDQARAAQALAPDLSDVVKYTRLARGIQNPAGSYPNGPYEDFYACDDVLRALAAPQQHAQAALSDDQLDVHINAILRPTGTKISSWRMQGDRDDMRAAMRAILATRQPAPVAHDDLIAAEDKGYVSGLRVGLLEGASILREVYVNHAFHTGLKGLEDRCKEAEQVLITKADAELAAPVAAAVQGDVATLIVRDVCELDGDYTDEDNVLRVSTHDLQQIVQNHLAAQPTADAAPVDAKPEAGQWVRCTPNLLLAGVSCADTPRRAGDGSYSHDHFISYLPAQPSTAQGEALSQEVGDFESYWKKRTEHLSEDMGLRAKALALDIWNSAQRAASQPETVPTTVANQAINDALRVGIQDSERDAALEEAAKLIDMHNPAHASAIRKLKCRKP